MMVENSTDVDQIFWYLVALCKDVKKDVKMRELSNKVEIPIKGKIVFDLSEKKNPNWILYVNAIRK